MKTVKPITIELSENSQLRVGAWKLEPSAEGERPQTYLTVTNFRKRGKGDFFPAKNISIPIRDAHQLSEAIDTFIADFKKAIKAVRR